MTDRDQFAAAALAGILANEGEGDSLSKTCQYAYRVADAMLRARAASAEKQSDVRDSRTADKPAETRKPTGVVDAWATAAAASMGCDSVIYTNHDVEPAAKARTDADRGSTDKAVTRPGEGTGNLQTPLWNPKPQEILPKSVVGVLFDDHLFKYVAKMGDGKTAWKDLPTLSSVPSGWAPSKPTLTDEEREALENEVELAEYQQRHDLVAILRGLLARLGGEK